MHSLSPSLVCVPAASSSQDEAARLSALLAQQQGRNLRGPLAGFFKSPCGVWLSLDAKLAGLPWRRTLVAVTRRNLLGGAFK